MKKNDVIEATILSVMSNGNGVCRHEGMAVFVPGALEGETHRIRIIKVYKNHCIGKSEARFSDSPSRILSSCPPFPRCGGCTWQHLTYEEELKIKTNQVKENMKRIGNLADQAVLPALPCPRTTGWRNKIMLPIGKDKNGNLVAGYYAERSHHIVPALCCTQQPEEVGIITQSLLTFFQKAHLSVYDETTKKGLLRAICFRINWVGEILLCLVLNGNKLKNDTTEQVFLSHIKENHPQIITLALNENRENTNVVLGQHTRILFEIKPFEDTIFEVSYPLSVSSFFQVNLLQTETLYRTAFSLLPTKKMAYVVDLFCGVGSIGLSLIKLYPAQVGRLLGVDIVPEAVENAKIAAKNAGIDNASFLSGDAGHWIHHALEENIPDLVIVDPPRKGCDNQLLHTLAENQIPFILYVSCDSATLARDMSKLIAAGYMASTVHTVDMFPRTGHVECVVLITRVKD